MKPRVITVHELGLARSRSGELVESSRIRSAAAKAVRFVADDADSRIQQSMASRVHTIVPCRRSIDMRWHP